jgi:pimeloyl-ACP methyl ester carboxylesterase
MFRRLGRFLIAVCLMGCFFALVLVGAGRTPPSWLPEPLQNSIFDVRLMLASPGKKLSSIAQGSFLDDRVYLDTHGEKFELENEGIKLVGTQYTPEGQGPFPGILLLHGSTPEGRKLGLYRILGRELARRGFVVVTLDRRGYGESGDPLHLNLAAAFDSTSDALAAINYLASLGHINMDNIHIIGHSAGAKPAFSAGVQTLSVQKIVAIGPPRRVSERLLSAEESEVSYFQRRKMRYMKLPESIPDEVYLELFLSRNLEGYLSYFTSDVHKPIFLIDGDLESEQDRQYLWQVYSEMSDPKKYLTLQDADHYANVANIGAIVFYDQRVMGELVQHLESWLKAD